MAENTAVAETKEAESRELVAKDFTEGMVVKIKQKEKFGLTFPKDYNYTNEFMSAMLILQDTVDINKKPVLQSCTRASIENALVEMVAELLKVRYGIDVQKEINLIPMQQLIRIYQRNNPLTINDTRQLLNDTAYSYMVLACTALKLQYKVQLLAAR